MHPFLVELKALMEKHKAAINFDCDSSSDTHGIYDPQMTFEIDRKEVVIAKGYGFDSSDI